MKGWKSMTIQTLKFEFEYGGICLWDNKGVIDHCMLPISDSLKEELTCICEEFDGVINWSDPHAPSPWTRKQCSDFFDRAEIILQRLQAELDGKYEIISRLNECRRIYLYENTFSGE